jgi:hypothetical protein
VKEPHFNTIVGAGNKGKTLFRAGNPCSMGRLGTVHLVVLTSSDLLSFILKILLTIVTKHTTLMRRSTVLSLPLQLVFPVQSK